MRNSSWCVVAACLGAAVGCTDTETADLDEVESHVQTTGDTDLAADCAGVLSFVNQASLAVLDAALPSNVAQGIVARRAVTPFVSIADLSSVSGIADARLRQIGEAARTNGYIGASCAGVIEELAVSADDRTAMLTFINTASTEDVIDSLRIATAEGIGAQLVAARPFTSLEQLSAHGSIGPMSFRGIRDASTTSPFDILAAAANATWSEVFFRMGFEPIEAMFPPAYGQSSGPECFGMPSAIVASAGGTMRPYLADGAEVLAAVTNAVAASGQTAVNPAAGLADIAAQVNGQTFYGCSLGWVPNPWCGLHRSFFVNTVTGFRVLIDGGWCE